ncbi:unnamed protein product [Auanema sp. JU1783]|nr:unnamed protein product [Auanema sp. JU1783]
MRRQDDGEHVKWMTGVQDGNAGIWTLPPCIALGDLYGDGDTKLIVAHLGPSMKLKVFKGITLVAESVLADFPTAIASFINDQTSLPAVAVASGSSLLIYKSLRPFYKFTVPSSPIHQVEAEAWHKAGQQELSYDDLFVVITNLVGEISPKRLTSVSQTLLITPEEYRTEFIDKYSQKELSNPSPITCLSTLKKSTADNLDMLVCGTEYGSIHIIDSQAFSTVSTINLPSVPVSIVPYGVYDVDYRIFVSTRSSQIFSLKRDMENVKPIITCRSSIIGFARLNKTLAVVCSNNTLTYYSFKGKFLNSIKIKEGEVQSIEPFHYAPKQYSGVLIMLSNEIRLYNDQYLLDVIKSDKSLQWIKFGQFGREEATLIMGTQDGGILVKLFRRVATFKEQQDVNPHPMSHNIKLNIPKKTKVFIDQTLREREHAGQIIQTFSKDLFLLRYHTTKAYADISTSNKMAVSTTASEPIEISVDINGFGPTFRMTINLTSSSKSPMYNMWISIIGNEKLYKIENRLIPVSILTSGNFYTYTTLIHCISPEKGISDDIRVLLVREGRTQPIVSAQVIMPISEMNLFD